MNRKDSERISRYLDGELSPGEMREVEKLIAASPEAREEFDAMKQIHEVTLDALPQTHFQRPRVLVRRGRSLYRAAAAAAVVLLFCGVVFGAVKVYEALTVENADPAFSGAPAPVAEETTVSVVASMDTTAPSGDTSPPSLVTAADGSAAAPHAVDPSTPPRLTGQVTDLSGNPIPRAEIRAIAWRGVSPYELDDLPLRRAVRSDAQGRFTMEWPNDARFVEIRARGYRSQTAGYTGQLLAPRVALNARLQPAMTCSGRVVDTAGAPIAGVRVASDGAEDPVLDVAVTDGSGAFSLSLQRPHETLFFWHPDYALTWLEGHEYDSDALIEATLEPGAAFRLRVLQGGQSVPGAKVRVVSTMPEALGYAVRRETDEKGSVLFEQVPMDLELLSRLGVVVTAPDGVMAVLNQAPEPRLGSIAESIVVLPDSYPGEVSGTVTDTDGGPVANAPVAIVGPGGWGRCVRTGADGSYRAGLAHGSNRVFLARDLLAAGQLAGEPSGGRFQVTSSETVFTQDMVVENAPVKRIQFVHPDGSAVDEVWLRMAPPMTFGDHSLEWNVSTAAGSVEFLGREATGRAFDLTARRMAFFSIPADEIEITVVLDESAGVIAGRVVDPGRKPLSGVSVTVFPNAPYCPRDAMSDDDGRFRIEPCAANTAHDLHLSLAGYQTRPGSLVNGVWPEQEASWREYVMAPQDAGLFGQVIAADGSPVAGAWVILADGERRVSSSICVDDGAFYFDVAAGAYTLWAFAPDMSAASSTTVVAPSHGIVVALALTTAPPIPASSVDVPQGVVHYNVTNNLKQMGLIFKMYANESKGAVFPPLEAQHGVFMPEFQQIYPEYLTDTRVLFMEDGVTRCYFAHALTSEAQGLAFLDAYAQLGPDAVRDQDIVVGAGRGTAGGDTLLRLSEDTSERALPNVPAGLVRSVFMASVPVFWEVPGDREESGGWVLYGDGHVQWVPYPGRFPMTEAFVTRLRGMMDQDR